MMTLTAVSASSCLFSNSWVLVWTLLEVNTLAFCSLGFMKYSKREKETKTSMMKYLIIQSIASSLLIFSSSLFFSTKTLGAFTAAAPVIALMLKSASAPIHQWFVTLSKKMNWMNNLILMTWQKLAPLFLLFYQIKNMIFIFILASAATGSISLFNKIMVKEIMALSSVFNLSWMLLGVLMSTKSFLVFSLMYWISVLFILTVFYKTNMDSVKDFTWAKKTHPSSILMLLSVGGLPPLLGFLAKWLMVVTSVKKEFVVLITSLLIISSVNLYVYLRSVNPAMMKNTPLTQKAKGKENKKMAWMFLIANSLSLTLTIL